MPGAIQQRHLTDFLRQEYGVEHTTLEHRSRHAKLIWLYANKTYSYMVSRSTNDGDATRSMQNAKSDIRRMLGRPPHLVPQRKPTMDELMDDVRERAIAIAPIEDAPETPQVDMPARTWSVLACAYHGSTAPRPQIQFIFPISITDTLPDFSIEQLDAENWKLRRAGPRCWRRVPWAGSMVRTSLGLDDTVPFRTMRVDAIEVDGEVLVYVPMAGRLPPDLSRRPKQTMPQAAPEPTVLEQRDLIEEGLAIAEAVTEPPPPPPEPFVPVTSLEGRLRGVLQQIREIEAQCPYRLNREGDRVVWQAPVIG